MLDVGVDAPDIPEDFQGDLVQLKKRHPDLFPHLVGNKLQSMRNLFSQDKVSIKLKAPYMDYIVAGAEMHAPIVSHGFGGLTSLAKGGLANGWGAGVFRYSDDDLTNFPIKYNDLAPYYDKLTEKIGISGANDDLEPWFLYDENLQPPLVLNPLMAELRERYIAQKDYLNGEGLFLGRPRMAILSEDKDERQAYQYDHMDYFRPHIPSIYTPTYTLDELIRDGAIDYRPGYLVKSFQENGDHVAVIAERLDTKEKELFRCRRLLLAAGALGSARIVLASAEDHSSRLPFLDNPMACIPVFRPGMLGKTITGKDASAGQLNLIYTRSEDTGPVLLYMLSSSSCLHTDILFETPLPATVARTILRQTSQAMGMAIVFYPGRQTAGNWVSLDEQGRLHVTCEPIHHPEVDKRLINLFRTMGFLSHRALVQHPPMGSGLHFAGMLPMRDNPSRYQCHPNGRLSGTKAVYVIDGSNFSALPAKNYSFTIMANAMRIARGAAQGKR